MSSNSVDMSTEEGLMDVVDLSEYKSKERNNNSKK